MDKKEELEKHLKAVIFLSERAKDMAEFYLQYQAPEIMFDNLIGDCKGIIDPLYDLMCEIDLIGVEEDITWVEELRFKEEEK